MEEVVAVSSAGDCSFAPVTPAKGLLEESRVGNKILAESPCLSGDGGGIGGVEPSLSGKTERLSAETGRPFLVETGGRFPDADEPSVFPGRCK